MKRRGHLSHAPDGQTVITPCGGAAEPTEIVVGHEPRQGEPLLPGQAIVQVERDPDGKHVLYEEVYRSGPPQVATEAFRRGWDATFGGGMVN